MNFKNTISSRYLLETAVKGRGMVRPGMREDRGGLERVRSVCRRSPKGGLWHGRVGRGSRRKGRRKVGKEKEVDF